MQIVILAGGKGTRLHPVTRAVPKCMLPIEGKPFLEHQLELLRSSGFRDIVLCVGHLGEQVLEHFGNGARLGLRLDYSWENGELLGTAGALKNASACLSDEFFLTYGDAYLRLQYREALQHFRASDRLALMAVYRNEDRIEASNVSIRDGLVTAYDKVNKAPDMVYINFGVSILQRRSLALVPEGVPYSQEEFFHDLIRRGQLLAFEADQVFQEIGSWAGVRRFQRLLRQSAAQKELARA